MLTSHSTRSSSGARMHAAHAAYELFLVRHDNAQYEGRGEGGRGQTEGVKKCGKMKLKRQRQQVDRFN